MADASTPEGNPFDIDQIRQLVKMMRHHELSEIDLRLGTGRLRLRRGGLPVSGPIMGGWSPAPAASAPSPVAAPAADSSTPASSSKPGHVISSPIVGTFYSASGPESAAFVSVGSKVTPETTVCIVEAMKVFNEIPAGVSGTIVEILAENGAAIEYGQPLFRVEPS